MNSLLIALVIAQADGITLDRRARVVSRDTVGRAAEVVRRETVKMQNGNVAIDDVTFGTRLVIRTDRKLAWVIDVQGGTYSEITFDDVARRRAQELAHLAEAKKRVAGTQDAEDIDRVMIGLGAPAAAPLVEVRETGKKEKVAGRECAGRSIVVNETDVVIDVFVDPSLADGLAYYDALAALGGFHAKVAEKVRALGGFPLKGRVRYALFLDRVYAEEETVAASRGAIAAADFDLPAGLKRVPLRNFDPDAGPKPAKPKSFVHSFEEDEREGTPLKKDEKPK